MTHDNNGRSIEVTLFLQITQVQRKAVTLPTLNCFLVDTATHFAMHPEMKIVQLFHGHELPALNFHVSISIPVVLQGRPCQRNFV